MNHPDGSKPPTGWFDFIALILVIFIIIMVLIPALDSLLNWLDL